MTLLTGLRAERAQGSRQFRDGRFHNTANVGPTMKGVSLSMVCEILLEGGSRAPHVPLPVDNPISVWASPISSGLRVTWLGHSALLLEIDGARVLVDPMFGERASPVSFAGARRFHRVPVSVAQMPRLDAVLLSHDHYDHLSVESMQAMGRLGVPIVTSLGVGARLEAMGVPAERITELDWWEAFTLPTHELSITATPAQHFSGRGVTDRNRTLWSSFVFTTSKRRVFFSGDTGLTTELATIAERFGPFDLTMLEIGASNPAWADIHLGPANALRAFELLGRGTLLPVHWGTFDLALHQWDEPPETLLQLAGPSARIITPRLGQPVEPIEVEGPTPWWREIRRRS